MPELSWSQAPRLALCYLLGSIPFAVLAMWGTGIDILRAGSGNPGFNNVLRFSRWRAAVTLAGDLGKGFLAIWLFQTPGDREASLWMYGLAAMLGHCYSPWLRFNGGKGIATSAGVMLFLYPRWALACAGSYVILRMVGSRGRWTERGTIASLSSSAVFVLLLYGFETRTAALGGAALLVFVAWRHRKNFRVLIGARASPENHAGRSG